MRQNLTKTVHQLLRTFSDPFDPYRPERHYMRGPGPKCQAKRSGVATPTAPDRDHAVPALREITKAHA